MHHLSLIYDLVILFAIRFTHGLKLQAEAEEFKNLLEAEDLEVFVNDKSRDACDDWEWSGPRSGTGSPKDFDIVGVPYAQRAWGQIDSPGRNSMSLATCRSHCEGHWQTEMNDNGFTDGGQFVYDFVKPNGQVLSRAVCTLWSTNSGGGIDICTSWFVTAQADITASYGLQLVGQSPSTKFTRDSELLSRACAIDNMGGDPHVINIKGESFDILELGVFNMLSISESKNISNTQKTLLNVDIEIARVGEECSEAYIRKVMIYGPRVSDFYDRGDHIEIRAQPKLEVRFNNKWTPLTEFYNTSQYLRASPKTPDYMTVVLPDMAINVDIANWNKMATYDAQAKVRKLGWSFLNIQIFGMKAIQKQENVVMTGLLVDDDHSKFKGLPNDCKSFYEGSKSSPFLSRVKGF